MKAKHAAATTSSALAAKSGGAGSEAALASFFQTAGAAQAAAAAAAYEEEEEEEAGEGGEGGGSGAKRMLSPSSPPPARSSQQQHGRTGAAAAAPAPRPTPPASGADLDPSRLCATLTLTGPGAADGWGAAPPAAGASVRDFSAANRQALQRTGLARVSLRGVASLEKLQVRAARRRRSRSLHHVRHVLVPRPPRLACSLSLSLLHFCSLARLLARSLVSSPARFLARSPRPAPTSAGLRRGAARAAAQRDSPHARLCEWSGVEWMLRGGEWICRGCAAARKHVRPHARVCVRAHAHHAS